MKSPGLRTSARHTRHMAFYTVPRKQSGLVRLDTNDATSEVAAGRLHFAERGLRTRPQAFPSFFFCWLVTAQSLISELAGRASKGRPVTSPAVSPAPFGCSQRVRKNSAVRISACTESRHATRNVYASQDQQTPLRKPEGKGFSDALAIRQDSGEDSFLKETNSRRCSSHWVIRCAPTRP